MSGKALLIVLDGLGDRGARTPLGEARTPCLDELTGRSVTGRMLSLGSWTVPGSDTAHLALLGYDPYEAYKGRGTFEALGAGMELSPGEVAFRCNLCTVDAGWVVKDRRAGRKDDGFAELYRGLDNMELEDCRARLLHTVEHRGALVLSGPGLSHRVGNTDPHVAGAKVAESRPLAVGGEKAARLLNLFTRRSYEVLDPHPANEKRRKSGLLPANIILSRGAGFVADVPSFPKRFGLSACCVAGGALYKGVARYLGMEAPDVAGATGTTATDLGAKVRAVLQARETHDFVFAHIKGTDSCGHDGQFDGKRVMIERCDREFLAPLAGQFDVIVVTGDHTTACSAKRHTADPVPFLFWHRDVRPDGTRKFCERECLHGGLGTLRGTDVIPMILDYLDLNPMFGE